MNDLAKWDNHNNNDDDDDDDRDYCEFQIECFSVSNG